MANEKSHQQDRMEAAIRTMKSAMRLSKNHPVRFIQLEAAIRTMKDAVAEEKRGTMKKHPGKNVSVTYTEL